MSLKVQYIPHKNIGTIAISAPIVATVATTPTNFRLSREVIILLRKASKDAGITKTQVIELCVLKHALSIAALASEARAALHSVAENNLVADCGNQDVRHG